MNSPGNPGLRPEMREFLAIEGRRRVQICWNRIWIHTSGTREAFAAMQDCVDAAQSTKPRGVIITGEPDTGKSRTMEAFRDAHPPTLNPETEYANHPVLYLMAPDNPSRAAILTKILQELGFPIHYKPSEEALREHTVRMLRKCAVGTVIIDEIGDIQRDYAGSKVFEFLRFLKGLINETGRPFVVGGTPKVLDLIAGEEQIAGRLNTVIRLKPFALPEFAKVMLAFELMLPLRQASDFRTQQDSIRFAFEHSGGYIGRLSQLLHDACQLAIEDKSERITLETLQGVKDRSIATIGRRPY